MSDNTIIDNTDLIGDVKVDNIVQEDVLKDFVDELRNLMIKYKVNKIDMGWVRDWSQHD